MHPSIRIMQKEDHSEKQGRTVEEIHQTYQQLNQRILPKPSPTPRDNIGKLVIIPDEILLIILSLLLSAKDLIQVELTCWYLNFLARQDMPWKPILKGNIFPLLSAKETCERQKRQTGYFLQQAFCKEYPMNKRKPQPFNHSITNRLMSYINTPFQLFFGTSILTVSNTTGEPSLEIQNLVFNESDEILRQKQNELEIINQYKFDSLLTLLCFALNSPNANAFMFLLSLLTPEKRSELKKFIIDHFFDQSSAGDTSQFILSYCIKQKVLFKFKPGEEPIYLALQSFKEHIGDERSCLKMIKFFMAYDRDCLNYTFESERQSLMEYVFDFRPRPKTNDPVIFDNWIAHRDRPSLLDNEQFAEYFVKAVIELDITKLIQGDPEKGGRTPLHSAIDFLAARNETGNEKPGNYYKTAITALYKAGEYNSINKILEYTLENHRHMFFKKFIHYFPDELLIDFQTPLQDKGDETRPSL